MPVPFEVFAAPGALLPSLANLVTAFANKKRSEASARRNERASLLEEKWREKQFGLQNTKFQFEQEQAQLRAETEQARAETAKLMDFAEAARRSAADAERGKYLAKQEENRAGDLARKSEADVARQKQANRDILAEALKSHYKTLGTDKESGLSAEQVENMELELGIRAPKQASNPTISGIANAAGSDFGDFSHLDDSTLQRAYADPSGAPEARLAMNQELLRRMKAKQTTPLESTLSSIASVAQGSDMMGAIVQTTDPATLLKIAQSTSDPEVIRAAQMRMLELAGANN